MNKKLGILYMIVASASFSTMSLFVKMSGSKLPLFEQILSRNLFIAVLSFFLLKRAGLSFLPEKENLKDLFLRCLYGFIAMVAVFYANRNMLLTDAQILQKLSPFLVAFFAWVLSKESVSRRTVLGMALAFAGAIFVIGPSGKFANPAAVAGLASAVFSALSYSFIHKLTGKEPGLRIIFLFSVFCFLAAIPLSIPGFVIPTSQDAGFLFAIGLLGAIGQYFVTNAYQMAPAAEVAIFDYTGLLISAILGFVFLSEFPTWTTFVGGFFILLGAWISAN